MTKKYIFRWKAEGIEVIPTLSRSIEESWQIAESGIYPAGMSSEEGRAFVHKYGEVVEVSE